VTSSVTHKTPSSPSAAAMAKKSKASKKKHGEPNGSHEKCVLMLLVH